MPVLKPQRDVPKTERQTETERRGRAHVRATRLHPKERPSSHKGCFYCSFKGWVPFRIPVKGSLCDLQLSLPKFNSRLLQTSPAAMAVWFPRSGLSAVNGLWLWV